MSANNVANGSDGAKPPVKHDAEVTIKRNPHPDFAKVQASRPDFDTKKGWSWSKSPAPEWKYGDGASDKSGNSKKHVGIDPNAPGRPAAFNYKLMISGVIPRPVGFVSTQSGDGTSTNLAPFSYTQMFNHDPPVFGIGFAGGWDNAKDTLKNLKETGECTINIIGEHFIEAANVCSMDLPHGQSEWSVSGLTPAPCDHVRPSRVLESVFSIEGKLMNTQEFESRVTQGKKTGVLCLIEGVKFWVREDAINEDQNLIDPAVLKPIARLGGITYARVADGFEIPRPVMKDEISLGKLDEHMVKPKVPGQ